MPAKKVPLTPIELEISLAHLEAEVVEATERLDYLQTQKAVLEYGIMAVAYYKTEFKRVIGNLEKKITRCRNALQTLSAPTASP